MASIISRNNRFYVICSYMDEQGKRKQKWETFKTLPEAEERKAQIVYSQQLGTFTIPSCTTLSDLLSEYVSLYGKVKWSISAYSSNTSLIKHYIEPYLGNIKLKEVTARSLEKYYQMLLKTPATRRATDRKNKKVTATVTPSTIRKVHSLLRSAFNQAEKWDLIDKNPAQYATIPKQEAKQREIWDAPTLFKAIECCEDQCLKLCLNLAFACSLRIGELLGLTWDCVDISEESIMAGNASIFVNKELQRVNKTVMNTLDSKDILVTFPNQSSKNKTVLVLKKPKTLTSTRKVFLPKSVAEMLVAWKMEQNSIIEALGSEYSDFQLVIAGSYGFPIESSRIRKAMKDLIKDNNLPPVVFHSLRHSSITYKLKLNGGDIKAVQGDSGHSQAQMVTDQYSHILDENRKQNAELLERAFYRGNGTGKITAKQQETAQPCQSFPASEADIAQAMKVLSDPEMVKLLKLLSKTVG